MSLTYYNIPYLTLIKVCYLTLLTSLSEYSKVCHDALLEREHNNNIICYLLFSSFKNYKCRALMITI